MLSLSPFLTTFKNIYNLWGTIWFASYKFTLILLYSCFELCSDLYQGILLWPKGWWKCFFTQILSEDWSASFSLPRPGARLAFPFLPPSTSPDCPFFESLSFTGLGFLWQPHFKFLILHRPISFLSCKTQDPRLQRWRTPPPPTASRTHPPHLPSF